MPKAIVVEIDEGPLSVKPPTEADYISRQLCSALYRPLVGWNYQNREVVPQVARAWTRSPDGLSWSFVLGDACWSDGTAITSEDCLRGIVTAAKHPLWKRYLAPVAELETAGARVLNLRLRRPFLPLLPLLATVDLAPAPPTKGLRQEKRLYSGAYQLVQNSFEGRYELIPNPVVPVLGPRPSLTFVVSRSGIPSIDGYLDGTYDVTSNTAFPLRRLPEWRASPALRRGETGITMQIEFNPSGQKWMANQRVRQMLFLALDRTSIARALSGGLRVADHFGPECWPELQDLALPQPDRDHALWLLKEVGRPAELLKIYYNDYHPNREVIEAVATQWRDVLGIRSETRAIDFSDTGRTDFDLILALRYPTIPSPWATLEHLVLLSELLGAGDAGKQARVLSTWSECERETTLPLKTLRPLFLASFPVVPLFHIIGYWLERPGSSFRYPKDGYFVYCDARTSND